jgi:hypothetical protein
MRQVVVLGLCALLAGCGVAHKSIQGDYADYNTVIQYTQSQQMLLNMVRLKYRESPLFLKVGALSASYSFEVRGGADFGKAGDTKLYGIDIGGSYATRPTITYTPLEGDTFVKQVLSEIEMDGFLLLFRSGWPITVLSHVMIERIGQYVNHPRSPTYADFNKIVDVLQEGQDANKLEFELEQDGSTTLVLRTDRIDLLSDERLDRERDLRFPVKSVQLRSFLDVMYSMGKNTEVPPAHADQVKDSAGNGWIKIHSSSNRPGNAMVSVQHNGFWFSIDETDIQSKDTFALVKLLYQMQAGDVPTVQPLLTLPVAQP